MYSSHFLVFFLLVVTANAVQQSPEVEKTLKEIRDLLFDHYNVDVEKLKNRPTPTKQDIEDAELLDDIEYSVPQVREILNGMKRRWGYQVQEDRIRANESYRWELPIPYFFEIDNHGERFFSIIYGFHICFFLYR